MNVLPKIPPHIFFICIATLSTACIVIRGEEAQNSQLEYFREKPLKVFQRWDIRTDSWEKSFKFSESSTSFYKETFKEVLLSTKCCVLVDRESEADIIADGIAIEYEPGFFAELGGRAYGVIPFWINPDNSVNIGITRGNVKYTYDLSKPETAVIWIPLIAAYPFMDDPFARKNSAYHQIFRQLVLLMERDGFLDYP